MRISVIGCGGIGGHVARHLCHFLHAERRTAHVTLVDGDAFEERNRSRMRFAALDNKALVLARELPPIASTLSVMFIPVLGVFSGAWWLGEVLHWQDWTAVALVMLSIATVLWPARSTAAT